MKMAGIRYKLDIFPTASYIYKYTPYGHFYPQTSGSSSRADSPSEDSPTIGYSGPVNRGLLCRYTLKNIMMKINIGKFVMSIVVFNSL